LGEDLHASVRCRSPLEGRIGIPHHAVQVREVGCRHGKDLSALVHSPPKNFGRPRGRCDVEPPGIAVAADEQIEYRALRRHRGERSIPGWRTFSGGGMDRRAAVGWPDVWAVIKASAERRLGKSLLKAYFFLAVFGIVVVAVALLVMRF
jgi:hypothetical protein